MKHYTKTQKTLLVLLPFVLFSLLYAIGRFALRYVHLIPPCLTYTVFGIHCTGCGITRSIQALLDGNIVLSLRQNVYPILFIILGLILYTQFMLRVFHKKVNFSVLEPKFLWGLLVFTALYTVLRNIFPVLAPV